MSRQKLTVLIGLFLAGCTSSPQTWESCGDAGPVTVTITVTDPDPLRKAKLQWNRWSCHDHEYVLRSGGFGTAQTVRVIVEDEKVTSIELIAGSSLHRNVPTLDITSVLVGLSKCDDDDECAWDARFHPEYGIPLEAVLQHPQIEDDFSRIVISDFRLRR